MSSRSSHLYGTQGELEAAKATGELLSRQVVTKVQAVFKYEERVAQLEAERSSTAEALTDAQEKAQVQSSHVCCEGGPKRDRVLGMQLQCRAS